jgi:hypothetical protein
MKTISLFTAALGLAAVVSAAPSFAEPPSYQLNCRAAPSMTATLRGDGTVTLRFQAAEGSGTPMRGQCTWVDRPLNDDEPQRIRATGDLARALIDDLLSGGRFSVMVYNDGAGNMLMTGD